MALFIASIWCKSNFKTHCSFLVCLMLDVTLDKIPKLAEWHSGSVSALPCERLGFGPHTGLREIILANNCNMQGQNNWGNWGSPGVMKLWVAWEVLRWLMKFRELCSVCFHPKLVTPPYHGFLNVNTPPNSQNSKMALSATQYASPRREA